MNESHKGKLRQIRWRDSRIYFTQCSKEDDFEVASIVSCGYVVQENSKQVTLAGDVIEGDGDVRRVIVIPKENIIK